MNGSVHLHIILIILIILTLGAPSHPAGDDAVPLVWAEARAAVIRLRIVNAPPVRRGPARQGGEGPHRRDRDRDGAAPQVRSWCRLMCDELQGERGDILVQSFLQQVCALQNSWTLLNDTMPL